MVISGSRSLVLLGCSIPLLLVFLGSTEAWSGNVCTRSVKAYRYEWYCRYRTWRSCCAWGRRRVTYYRRVSFCCNGWQETSPGNHICNKPVCRPYCFNGGTCIKPNACSCPAGLTGRLCESKACASHLKPCYPGWCDNNKCKCSTDFGGSGCEEVQSPTYKPLIDSCQTAFSLFDRVKDMQMYQYKVDATGKDDTEIIWSNQNNYNIINMTFDVSLDFESLQEALPMKPDYISDFKIGVVSAMVETNFSRLPKTGESDREVVPEGARTYTCQGISNRNPVTNDELKCRLDEDSFQLAIRSGDRFTFKFSAKTGGFRSLINTDNNQLYQTQNYIGNIETVKTMEFRFDFEVPEHCNSSCPSQLPPLRVVSDITQSPIDARWSGWSDELSGVADYTLEIFKLIPNQFSKFLEEPHPLEPVELFRFNHTNSGFEYAQSYIPPEPGMYSLILEIRDTANNTVYVRRFALYDPVSDITVSNAHRLEVVSAEQGTAYRWQSFYGNSTSQTIINVSWKDYFANKIHEENYLLNSINPYPNQLNDGGRRGKGYKRILEEFEDNEGARTTAEIPNSRGIVAFDIVSDYAGDGGSSLVNPPNSWRTVDGIKDGDTQSFDAGAITDGSTAKVWVRAHDAMGNTRTESTLVSFDMSDPEVITEPLMQANIANGTFPFSSRINVGCRDIHSGVYKIHWRLRMANNRSFVKMEGDAINPVQTSTCNIDCYRTRIDEWYNRSVEFDINHCWMRVPKENLDTQVMEIEMEIFNSAMLFVTRLMTIDSIRRFSGIEDYFGPMHIQMTRQSETGVSLSWDHAPSCYERDTILVVVVMPDNSTKTLRADKDADRFDITGLVANTYYPLQLYTVYIIDYDTSETILSEVSTYFIKTSPKPEDSGISGGAIAAIVIVILLLIIIAIGIVLLWRTGKLQVMLERIRTRREQDAPSVGFSNGPYLREKVFNGRGEKNKAYSRNFDEDMIYYGEVDLSKQPWSLSRKAISLEEQIKSGRFATIYKAKMFSTHQTDADTVVVKSLKSDHTDKDLTLMKAKINFYGSEVGNHPNVLKFFGAVEDIAMGPFMVLEYCENGTMKDYLTSHKDRVDEQMHERLFKFTFDVSKGMEYLANKKIVHRRLAARNILLTFLHEVKISGFGPVPNEDDENAKGERIPVKWLPPECIEASSTRDATEKSDVWSYGIVMWEIFTLGDVPFPDIRAASLLSHLRKGERPPKPEYADQKMHGLMRKCWNDTPKKRPSFAKLRAELEILFVSSGDDEFYYDNKFIYDNKR